MSKRVRPDTSATTVSLDPVLAELLSLRAAHAAGQLVARLREIQTVCETENDSIQLGIINAVLQEELKEVGYPEPAKMAAAVLRHRSSLNGTGSQALPEIDAADRDVPHIAAQAWDAVKQANDPPRLFLVGTLPARLELSDTDAPPGTQPLTIDRLKYELARMAKFFVQTEKMGRRPAVPPEHLVRDMLAHPDPPLPILRRIVSAPFFTADGALVTRPGYDPHGIYYAPSPGLEKLADVAATPTAEERRRAKALLVDDLLVNFPFVAAPDLAHAIGLLLLLFVRDLVDGPTPLHTVDKPSPGTGASLLCQALLIPALGRAPAAMTEPRDEDESRKRIFAALAGKSPVIFIDNVRRRLDSAALSSALTMLEVQDRPLGVSQLATVPNRALWVANGNNLSLSNEIARRSVRTRLDTKRDRPAERDPATFKHPLPGWAMEHRADLVWAALLLARSWLAAGRPAGSRVLGSFEAWSHVIGGILAHAEIDGFLGNTRELYEQSDSEGAENRRLLGAWWEKFGAAEVGVRELLEVALDDRVGLPLTDKSPQATKVQLGQRLASLRDRHYRIPTAAGDVEVRLAAAGKQQRAVLWQLLPAASPGAGTDSLRLTDSPKTAGESVSLVSLGESNPAPSARHGEGCTCLVCVPPGSEDFAFPGAEPRP